MLACFVLLLSRLRRRARNQGQCPQRADPVVMVLWEQAGQPPRVLQAARVRQVRAAPDSAQLQTECEEVMLRLPLGDGEMVLTAPQAIIDETKGVIVFTPPIRLAGAVESRPFQGRAWGAQMNTKDMVLTMDEVEWLHNGQRSRVQRLELKDEWRSRIAEMPSGEPAPLVLTAGQSALPFPMELPPFRRQIEGKESD